MSKYYRFRPQYVGLCVLAIPLGALLAIPFQKASLRSRSRNQAPRTDSMTFEKRITWTSHLIRRAFFMLLLPLAGLAYTLSSGGPSTHFLLPTFFSGVIGFLTNLAIAECDGLIMETYDTSDLPPGEHTTTRRMSDDRKRINDYSCFPRVSAGFAIVQTLGFLMAAAATGVGGAIERRLGAQAATGAVAGVLLLLTMSLVGVLWRWKEVQVIPDARSHDDDKGGGAGTGAWRPVIIGTPSGKVRRMSLLELSRQSRWTEIRRWNRLL